MNERKMDGEKKRKRNIEKEERKRMKWKKMREWIKEKIMKSKNRKTQNEE